MTNDKDQILKLVFNISLYDLLVRNLHLTSPVGNKRNAVASQANQLASKVSLAVYWLRGLNLDSTAREPLVISTLV